MVERVLFGPGGATEAKQDDVVAALASLLLEDFATEATLQAVLAELSATRTLTERMLAKAPQDGYKLWLDTADASHLYIAEGPTGDDPAADATWQGVRVPKGVGGLIGAVETSVGFVWDDRTSATWVA